MANILSLKEAAKTVSNLRRRDLLSYKKELADKPESDQLILTRINMLFWDASTGDQVYFGRIRRDLRDELEMLDFQQNKQYSWLLTEAYEAFEDFLEHLYANAGSHDADFWNPIHLKGADLTSLDWEWCLKQAVSRLDADEIMKQFRKKLSSFSRVETNNALGIDLRFTLEFIAQMRHHIVHTRGEVKDRDDFARKILEKIGRWNNGKPSPYRDEINDVFFLPPHENTIALLERRIKSDHFLPTHMDIMQNFCRALLSIARALTQALITHQATGADSPHTARLD